MKHLKEYISESILSSVGAGKTAIINKIVNNKDFTQENIAILEKSASVWKPKDKRELIDIIRAYIKSAGSECSLNWIDVSDIKDMSKLFFQLWFNGNISKWDVSNVENMNTMFGYSKFYGDISNWDTHNVTDMSYMFYHSKFNGDISKWNTSNVTYMSSMFSYSKFNSDISKWDVSKVKNMNSMFERSNIQEKYKPVIK